MLPGAGVPNAAGAMELCWRAKLDCWGDKDRLMLILEISGGVFVFLFIAAAMAGIEGNEHR
jgi:hypothetical protein